MKTIGVVLFNIATVIGGHFLNRHWDKAVLFLCVLVLSVYLGISILFLYLQPSEGYDIVSLSKWQIFVLATVVAISTLVLIFDLKKVDGESIHSWTITGVIAAVLLTIISTGIAGQIIWMNWQMKKLSDMRVTEDIDINNSVISEYNDRYFIQQLNFKSANTSRRDLSEPPNGEGVLLGEVTFQGKPVEGVSIELILNDQYNTKSVESDSRGIFQVSLASGNYRVNTIIVNGWKDKPKGEYLVVSGHEKDIHDGHYYSHVWNENPLSAPTDSNEPFIILDIRPVVDIISPSEERSDFGGQLENQVIKWDAYPNAREYIVSLSKITRDDEGGSSWSNSVTRRVKNSTSLNLSDLPIVSESGDSNEYVVEVYAFDGEGKFLSESERYSKSHSFIVSNLRFVEDNAIKQLGLDWNETEYLNLRENKQRINAIEQLIEDDLLDEAEALLSKVIGEAPKGRKAALHGYLLAKRGECQTAETLFSQAVKEGGKSCLPSYYREPCQ